MPGNDAPMAWQKSKFFAVDGPATMWIARRMQRLQPAAVRIALLDPARKRWMGFEKGQIYRPYLVVPIGRDMYGDRNMNWVRLKAQQVGKSTNVSVTFFCRSRSLEVVRPFSLQTRSLDSRHAKRLQSFVLMWSAGGMDPWVNAGVAPALHLQTASWPGRRTVSFAVWASACACIVPEIKAVYSHKQPQATWTAHEKLTIRR